MEVDPLADIHLQENVVCFQLNNEDAVPIEDAVVSIDGNETVEMVVLMDAQDFPVIEMAETTTVNSDGEILTQTYEQPSQEIIQLITAAANEDDSGLGRDKRICIDAISEKLKTPDYITNIDFLTNQTSAADIKQESIVIYASDTIYACNKCNKCFSDGQELDDHTIKCLQTFKRFPCNQCHKRFNQAAHLRQHMLIHSGQRNHACGECGKAFTQVAHLRQHMLTHFGIKDHECQVCKKRFTQLGHLKQHLLIHSGTRNHPCNQCNKRFTQAAHLRQHLLTHSGRKDFACSVCEKRFSQMVHLKKHMSTHPGKKDFTCPQCPKSFSFPGSLKQHMILHTGERKHACSQCEKRFFHPSQLKQHTLVVHCATREHGCSECGKWFKTKAQLKKHAATHSVDSKFTPLSIERKYYEMPNMNPNGPFTYNCAQCNINFSDLENLKSHKLLHAGNDDLVCILCERTFFWVEDLKKHILLKH